MWCLLARRATARPAWSAYRRTTRHRRHDGQVVRRPDTLASSGSWGGILAIEYALAHQEHLKGLVVANMVSSIAIYRRYVDEALKPAWTKGLSEMSALEDSGKTDDPRYGALFGAFRGSMSDGLEDMPDSHRRGVGHINREIYERL